jgi:hypothetical protein
MKKIITAMIILAMVLVAGCGGPRVDDYAKQVNTDQTEAGQKIADLGIGITPESPAENDRGVVDQQLGELSTLARDLGGVSKEDIPDGMKSAHEAYVNWVAGLDQALSGFGTPAFKQALNVQTIQGKRLIENLNRRGNESASSGFHLGVEDAYAGIGGGSRSSSSSSSGSRSSGSSGSKSSGSSKSSGGSKSASGGSSGSKTVSASKPSSGSKTAPPVSKTIPKTLPPKISTPTRVTTPSGTKTIPPKVSVPAGRTYQRDSAFLNSSRGRRYTDPYSYRSGGYYGTPLYYGAYDSPFFYMWLFSVTDDDHSNDGLPPSSDGFVDESLLSYLQVLGAESDLEAAKK